jgi:hypothetical protein
MEKSTVDLRKPAIGPAETTVRVRTAVGDVSIDSADNRLLVWETRCEKISIGSLSECPEGALLHLPSEHDPCFAVGSGKDAPELPEGHGIIYIGACLPTRQLYVGYSKHCSPYRRYRGRLSWLRSEVDRRSGKGKLFEALRKFGPEGFFFFKHRTAPVSLLPRLERHYIQFYDTMRNGLNDSEGGEPFFGNLSPEAARRHAESCRRPEYRRKMREFRHGKVFEWILPEGTRVTAGVRELVAMRPDLNLKQSSLWQVTKGLRTHHKNVRLVLTPHAEA